MLPQPREDRSPLGFRSNCSCGARHVYAPLGSVEAAHGGALGGNTASPSSVDNADGRAGRIRYERSGRSRNVGRVLPIYQPRQCGGADGSMCPDFLPGSGARKTNQDSLCLVVTMIS